MTLHWTQCCQGCTVGLFRFIDLLSAFLSPFLCSISPPLFPLFVNYLISLIIWNIVFGTSLLQLVSAGYSPPPLLFLLDRLSHPSSSPQSAHRIFGCLLAMLQTIPRPKESKTQTDLPNVASGNDGSGLQFAPLYRLCDEHWNFLLSTAQAVFSPIIPASGLAPRDGLHRTNSGDLSQASRESRRDGLHRTNSGDLSQALRGGLHRTNSGDLSQALRDSRFRSTISSEKRGIGSVDELLERGGLVFEVFASLIDQALVCGRHLKQVLDPSRLCSAETCVATAVLEYCAQLPEGSDFAAIVELFDANEEFVFSSKLLERAVYRVRRALDGVVALAAEIPQRLSLPRRRSAGVMSLRPSCDIRRTNASLPPVRESRVAVEAEDSPAAPLSCGTSSSSSASSSLPLSSSLFATSSFAAAAGAALGGSAATSHCSTQPVVVSSARPPSLLISSSKLPVLSSSDELCTSLGKSRWLGAPQPAEPRADTSALPIVRSNPVVRCSPSPHAKRKRPNLASPRRRTLSFPASRLVASVQEKEEDRPSLATGPLTHPLRDAISRLFSFAGATKSNTKTTPSSSVDVACADEPSLGMDSKASLTKRRPLSSSRRSPFAATEAGSDTRYQTGTNYSHAISRPISGSPSAPSSQSATSDGLGSASHPIALDDDDDDDDDEDAPLVPRKLSASSPFFLSTNLTPKSRLRPPTPLTPSTGETESLRRYQRTGARDSDPAVHVFTRPLLHPGNRERELVDAPVSARQPRTCDRSEVQCSPSHTTERHLLSPLSGVTRVAPRVASSNAKSVLSVDRNTVLHTASAARTPTPALPSTMRVVGRPSAGTTSTTSSGVSDSRFAERTLVNRRR